jgi:hypothetical protein|tara:strand:+ start:1572 stop:1733 length:162 start_codon:yes stop_codon:yes gene_type:complete
MKRDKLKLLIKNLEVLLEEIKTEVYADKDAYLPKDPEFGFRYYGRDDDDGYAD